MCWPKLGRQSQRIAILLGLVGLLLLIGFSRMYVRDHYLGDVLAGYTVGLSWLAVCVGVWAAGGRQTFASDD
jgi:undecaprenyl-diphosphatase